MKLWINEHDFIKIDDKKSLSVEFAPRSRSIDWMGIFGFLPDPDPVLQKLGQDITIYRNLVSDAHVWSCYQSRKSGTLSCEWQIQESEKRSRLNKSVHHMISEMMKSLDVYQVINDMLEAPFYGMSPIEVIWKSTEAAWIPNSVLGKPPEWFMFDPENHLKFKSKDDMIEGEDIPDYKFLLCRHHASYQNPYGERLLSRCFWPVAFKKGGFKFWVVFTEKWGMPWAVGKVPPSTSDTERDRVLSNLKKMIADAVAVINNDESIEIIEASGKGASADIYEKLVSASNREISKAILGQTLSTELDKGGSYAATKGHLEVREDLVDQDKRMVKTAWNLLLQWVVDLNFAGADPPEFKFFEEEDIREDQAKRDESLSKQGVRFTPKYYQRTYNLEEDDFILGEPQSAVASQFAESGRYSGNQRNIENLVASSMSRAIAALSGLSEPVKKIIREAGSLEEVRDKLISTYGDMDRAEFSDLLARAMFTAELYGRSAVKHEMEKQERKAAK